MIYKKCVMTIDKNKATLDEDIYLYRLDKNIELYFTIVNNKYRFNKGDMNNIILITNASFFQVRLYKNADIKYTFAIQPTQDGVAILTITDDLIDDPIEVGDYDFQISLLDEEKTSMISMPIVSKQLHVCEPLVSDDATMGKAILGLSKLATGEIKNAFDSDGNYIREIHQDGDILSASIINKFEEALETNTKAIKAGTGTSYDDTKIKTDINTIKTDLGTDELTTTAKNIKGSINEVAAQYKDIAKKTIIQDNKLYLTRADGTKIDTGTTLPTPSTSAEGTDVNINTIINSSSNLQSKTYNVKPIRPLISFTDDDGKAGVYTKWKPILQEKGIPLNIAIITNTVGNNGYLTWEQIQELQDTYGCEILSHTVTHANIGTHTTNKTWIEELKQSKLTLMEHGLNIRGLAYPNGGYWGTKEGLVDDTSNGYWMTGLFYDYGVTTSSTINKHPLSTNMGIDRAGIGCYQATGFDTLAGMKAKVDECIATNGWLIFMTHIDDVAHTDQDTQDIKDLIDYIKTKGVSIVTLSEGFEIFGNAIETPKCKITKQGNATLDVTSEVPKATTSTAGLVQVGSGLTINDGVLAIDNALYYSKEYLDNIIDTMQTDIENLKNNSGSGGSPSDSAPIISNIANITIAPNTSFIITYSVTDNDGIGSHLLSMDNGVEYSTIEPVAGENNTYTYTTTLATEGTYYCKLKVVDTLGNSSIKSFTISVQYNKFIPDKITTQGECTNKGDGVFVLTDSSAYDNFMMYDTQNKLADTNKTYKLCIQTIEKNIQGTPNFDIGRSWIMENLTDITLDNLIVGETLKSDFNISQAFTSNDRILYMQFDKTGTGSTLKVKVWIEY